MDPSSLHAPSGLHADVQHLGFLLGTWRGRGTGCYPTIEDFIYDEEIAIDHVGDSYLTYLQRSWAPEDGAAIHLERGFLRAGDDGQVELMLAHPLGLTEIGHGTLTGTTLAFASEPGAIGRSHSGSDVTALARRYHVEGDRLTYEIDMATERTPMTAHLRASLERRA